MTPPQPQRRPTTTARCSSHADKDGAVVIGGGERGRLSAGIGCLQLRMRLINHARMSCHVRSRIIVMAGRQEEEEEKAEFFRLVVWTLPEKEDYLGLQGSEPEESMP